MLVPETFAAPDGTRLAFHDAGGAGPAVLCLAGLTRNMGDFDHVAPHLAGRARLIRLDMRGRGRSEWPGPAGYTIPQEAGDALALMDHLGLARAAILGTSRGGLVAMAIASFAPGRLSGVALNDIGPEISDQGYDIIKSYLGRSPAERSLAEAAEARSRNWTQFRGVPMARWLHEVGNHYEETPDGLRLCYDPRLRDAVLSGGPIPDLWPFFDALAGLPLCLIRGAGSDLLTAATARAMAARRPDMILAEVPDRGHVPFLDEPAALAALHRWLDLCEARP